MKKDREFAGKKVLVFGLGILGGGVATTNWLIRHGAEVTVTDLKDADALAPALEKIEGEVNFRLGGHDESYIRENEIIVANPDVPSKSKYLELARDLGKQIENEATIFYKHCQTPIVAITGTRGKTTTVNWLHHFVGNSIMAGNSYDFPLLSVLDEADKYDIVVNEIPSFHLELFDKPDHGPQIAVITNIYRDHLNRYESFEDYASTKGNIFRGQDESQHLVLNADNEWTPFLLKKKPRSKLWFFSKQSLDQDRDGVYPEGDHIVFRNKGDKKIVLNISGFTDEWGEHNLENLLASTLASNLAGIAWEDIQERISTLVGVKYRQEIIYKDDKLKVVNDTAATTEEGGIAGVKRFGGDNCILIAGGTDKELEYDEWARIVKKYIKPENLILLSGSSTDKMIKALGPISEQIVVLDTLEECVDLALGKASATKKATILFSPSAKSFEKFKNEYDRGEQFEKLIKEKI